MPNLNFLANNTKINANEEATNKTIELFKFSLSTLIGLNPLITRAKNQVKPRLAKISKILEPTALLIAVSPNPSLAVFTEAKKSGTLVPTAKIVRLIITGLILKMLASSTAELTITVLKKITATTETNRLEP